MLDESLVKYLSGLLDADGHLGFDAHRGYDGLVRISLKMSLASADTIDTRGFVPGLPALTGMGTTQRQLNRYNYWIVCHRADLEMLLPRLIKHMVIKAKHWQWMLEIWRSYRNQFRGQRSMSVSEWEVIAQASRESRKLNVGPIHPKNHPTWAWLAGYLDGDGCYSFRTSRNHNMRLSVTAHITDVSCLEFLQKHFGGTIRMNSRTQNVRVWWRGLGPRDRSFALDFLSNIVGHAQFKRHKIEQMIHFLRHQQRLSVSGATAQAIV